MTTAQKILVPIINIALIFFYMLFMAIVMLGTFELSRYVFRTLNGKPKTRQVIVEDNSVKQLKLP